MGLLIDREYIPHYKDRDIYLHHLEYQGHSLPSTKSGQHGDGPYGQQDAKGSGHARKEKKIFLYTLRPKLNTC